MASEHKDEIPWTLEEKVFKTKQGRFKDVAAMDISFTKSLTYKLKKSVFGVFLKELNSKQNFTPELNENKLQILNWQIKKYNTHDTEIVKERNRIFRQYLENLNRGVTKGAEIDLKYLERSMKALFLDLSYVKVLDETLNKFRNLTVLTLTGNYLEDIQGSMLPRKLLFLELFDNLLVRLEKFCKYLPKGLMHIGLGRNRLNDDSEFHLLHTSANLQLLKSLDLSDNDIYCLNKILTELQSIKTLSSLSLEGNPCAVVPEYKNLTLTNFPKLIYLDQTTILDEDRKDLNCEKNKPQVRFYGFRVLGLPEPPKDAKNIQAFYFEVNFPLLVKKLSKEILDKLEETEKADKENKTIKKSNKNEKNKREKDKFSKPDKHSKSSKKNKSSNNSKKSNTSGKTGKRGKKNYYKLPNEYSLKEEIKNVWFKSERQKWSKIIEFPEIIVEARVQGNELQLIRDTFRCKVEVKLIYLKIAPYDSKKKHLKETKQAKRLQKTDLTSIGNENVDDNRSEIVLKKSTIAHFDCNLKSINWSEKTLDFYWADHPDIGAQAIRVDGSLKVHLLGRKSYVLALEYESTPDHKKIQKKPKVLKKNSLIKSLLSSSTEALVVNPKEKFPKILTCQIGIGLLRN